MEHALRNWKCTACGQPNRTVMTLDGTAECAHCAEKVSLQPSRDYLRKFSVLHPEVPPTRFEERWL
jgi:hypothetical protein